MPKNDSRPVFRLPASLRGLVDLAYDNWWSFGAGARAFWERLAERARLSASARTPLNPVRVLSKLGRKEVAALAEDREFLRELRELLRRHRTECSSSRRGRGRGLGKDLSARRPVAYFSMEFGVNAALPIYAGGLGILAGDHVKSAHDIGLPLVGVGLIYREGYFRQEIDAAGEQKVVYPTASYGELPIELVRSAGGRELRVAVDLPPAGRSKGKVRRVQLRVWRIRVGTVSVYLLDSDFSANPSRDRALTRRLYGGTREDRIAQECLLGIGGVRLLRALGVDPSVWHLNEGHVAFTSLERMRELVLAKKDALDFHEALELVASNTVFTTHTPVPEGNEVFDLPLARRYLEPHCPASEILVDDYLQLGLDVDELERPVLSMTVLAIRVSRFRNGVSALHGIVSRAMWHHLWPDFDEDDAPITSVTNGVHVATWISPEMAAVFDAALPEDWRSRVDDSELWKAATKISDRTLWETRNALRARVIAIVRERVARQLRRNGASAEKAARDVESLLDPDAFTIGFARRFALYKRADLIFRDIEKAVRLFNRKSRPVQIIFAGKPHPEDPAGKALLERIIALSRRKGLRGKVVVVENYDMEIGAALVQGCDLWLNNPIRPQEASGTSGQKVPFNGGLNASVLDGWWFEGYDEGVGWSIGKDHDHDHDHDHDDDHQHRHRDGAAKRDREDAADLVRVLERQVLPLFYKRTKGGLPREWLRVVKRSMAALIPRFSSQHMLRRYVESLYLPAAENGREMGAQGARIARELVSWRERVESAWPLVHLRELELDPERDLLVAEYFLAGLDAEDVLLEVWPGGAHEAAEEIWRPTRARERAGGCTRFEIPVREADIERLRLRIWPYHPAFPHSVETGLADEVEAE